MESVLSALEAWFITERVVVALQAKSPKDPSVSANAKTMSSSIRTETASLAVLMRPFPTANAPVKLDTLEIHAEYVVFHAQTANLSSKEPAPAAHSTPFTTLPSMVAPALTASTWMHMESAKFSPLSQLLARMDNISIPTMDASPAAQSASHAEDPTNASPAPRMASQPTLKDFASPPAVMASSFLQRLVILEAMRQMDALAAELYQDILAVDNHQSADQLLLLQPQ